jgi:formiminoglutamase
MIRFYTKSEITALINAREGEKKVGELLNIAHSEDDLEKYLSSNEIKYFILGVPEDIGPRANHGKPGSHLAFQAFLQSFLNHQANKYFPLEKIAFLGRLPIKHLQKNSEEDSIALLREKTSKIDSALFPVIQRLSAHGKIPIVVGGGHNNAYPNIKGISLAKKQAISVINLDPHADFRQKEGRHSGNGFSYAWDEGFLNEYHVFGLNPYFNSEEMLDRMMEEEVSFTPFEPSFCTYTGFENMLSLALGKMKGERLGIELDLDSIANFPVSAITPDGITLQQAKEYARICGNDPRSSYLHICEGSPVHMENGDIIIGKSISSIILSFISGNSKTFD